MTLEEKKNMHVLIIESLGEPVQIITITTMTAENTIKDLFTCLKPVYALSLLLHKTIPFKLVSLQNHIDLFHSNPF